MWKHERLQLMWSVKQCPAFTAYLYRELLARFGLPIYDYIVATVSRPNDSTIDAFVEPAGPSLTFEPGQFIFLAFGGTNGLAVPPIHNNLQPGTPAKAAGPFGGIDYRRGGDGRSGSRAVWASPRSSAESTPCPTTSTARWPSPTRSATHPQPSSSMRSSGRRSQFDPATALVDSSKDGFLTADIVVADLPAHAAASVYKCGPPAMTNAMVNGVASLGIPRKQIGWEQFNIR